ncbi:retinol dehydrogenase 10 [Elysia marginata]|uniref:Short-chain dehydrogenase/reductase 3 n=1 Tax=Elysia marginata TaxID=1093978 RepID=A0AAV4JII1_9GAST|nr:retinol dehydrogenase 10 [Elysia marginata]
MAFQTLSTAWGFVRTLCFILWKSIVHWLKPSEKDLTEDVILITGGGRGIGRSLALQFAQKQPKHIILWERNEAALSHTAKEVQMLGVNCSFMVCDVSSKDQVYALAKEVQAKFGHVTILVNNAGVVNPGSFLVNKNEKIEQTLHTNTFAHFWTTRAFLPSMIESNRGHIVTVSSMLGLAGLNGVVDYCTSKFAVTGFSEALKMELRDMGVTGVNLTTVHPYLVDNAMFAGATTRFPSLFPPVTEKYLSQKITAAVLSNRSVLCVPKLMYFVVLFYCIAPVSAVLAVMKFLQVNKTIDNLHSQTSADSSLLVKRPST